MVCYKKQFIALLEEAVGEDANIIYDSFVEEEQTPCVSYLEIANISTADGNTVRYSRITFQVRIWDTAVGVVEDLAETIDDTLVSNGFSRVYATDLKDGDFIVRVIQFQGNGFEINQEEE